MGLPEPASTAPSVTRTVIMVSAGNPASAGAKITVSRAADQVKVPGTDGIVAKFVCTLFVSIGVLNCSTMGEWAGTLLASCAGELLTTTGSSGFQSDCATKILAAVPGTVMGGISGVEVTVSTSFVLSRLMIWVPAAKVVGRLLRTCVLVEVLSTTNTSSVPRRRA